MNPKLRKDPYRLVGTTIGGFLVAEFIQSGGMGAVYRARPVRANITIAIKILKPDLALQNPEVAELLFKEAEQTAALNHPNIIRVTHADVTESGYAFIVMEWLDGRSLEKELKEREELEPDRVVMLLEQICEAVSHAHKHGVVHRDLKPSNIMVVRDHAGEEQVKVLDFGIAKALDTTLGFNSRIIGAPYYASPEQLILNARIDHRADIYSLGVTAYQLLTGELPFDSDSIEQVISQQLTGAPRPLSEVRPGIPAAVESVIMRALAKRPEERFQDAREFARALRSAVSLGSATINLRCVTAGTHEAVAGVSVYLNGKYAGRTDEQGAWGQTGLAPKMYELEAENYWHESQSRDVTCKAGEELNVEIELAFKAFGALLVRATAAQAVVVLNGRRVGSTDESGSLHIPKLEPGTARLKLYHHKFQEAAAEVEIERGQEQSVQVEMSPLPRRTPFQWFRRKTLGKAQTPQREGRGLWSKALAACGVVCVLAAVAVGAWQSFRYYTMRTLVIQTSHPGARVSINGLPGGLSDDFGTLIIKNLRSGKYLVEVSADGFLRQQREVVITEPETIATFSLLHDAPRRVEAGNKLYEANDFPGAEAMYRAALGIEPENAAYRKLLGDALLQQEDKIGAAEVEYNRACQISPGQATYHFSLGVVRSKLGKFDEAVEAFSIAIRTSGDGGPESAPYFAERGNAYLKLNRYDAALGDARQAVRLDDQNHSYHCMLGDILFVKGNHGDAIKAHQKAVKMMPANDEYYFKLAEDYYEKAMEESVPVEDMPPYLTRAMDNCKAASRLTSDADKKRKYEEGYKKAKDELQSVSAYVPDEESEP